MIWPASRAAEALDALARAARLEVRESLPTPTPDAAQGGDALGRYIDAAAAWLGVEAEPVAVCHGDADDLLRRGGPCLVVMGSELIAFHGVRGNRLQVIAPDGPLEVPIAEVRQRICAAAEAPLAGQLDGVLEAAGIPTRRRARAHAALLAERLARKEVARAHLLRGAPGGRPMAEARRARVPLRLAGLTVLHVVQFGLGLAAWAVIGRAALEGRFNRGWLLAWLLLLLTLIPLRLLTTWVGGRVAIDVGAWVKQRLFSGALSLDPAALRRRGAGQFLGTVIESSAIEQTAIGGGVNALLAIIELGAAGVVLALGGGGAAAVIAFVAWCGLTLWMAWRYGRLRRDWTDGRLAMTHDLVESMVGQRTRLAQEDPSRWHENEDVHLERYLDKSRRLDRAQALLVGLLPRAWVVVGILTLLPAVALAPGNVTALAVGLGGVLLAERSLRRLVFGVSQLAAASIAWREARPLFAAAAVVEPPGSPALASVHTAPREGRAILEAHQLAFRHPDAAEPVLRGASLVVRAGERLLLTGASGAGKSTLASVLVGIRPAASGLLLLSGMDRPTLGSVGWRRRITAAPQFHENHVFLGTLAFNVLLGRQWPPEAEHLVEAETICRELGLGPLLDRMPSGMSQTIGETGWQLSHGERSRLYIARALLQQADVVILDESFGALDAQTLDQVVDCVLRRARALIVIAHS